MKKLMPLILALVILLIPSLPAFSRAESVDVLVKGVYDGKKTTRDRAYKEALINAKLSAIERAGVEVKSFTKIENFTLKYDMVESKAQAVLMPGFQVVDMGYQIDGTYQVVLSGKVQLSPKNLTEGKLWGKLRAKPVKFKNFAEAFESWSASFPSRIDNQYVNNENGSISDLKTGLMWHFSYKMTETPMSAEAYIAELNAKKHAGYSDWRIPTTAEIASLIEDKPSAKLDGGRESFLDGIFDADKYCWYLWSADTAQDRGLLVYIGEPRSGIAKAGDHYQSDNICVACLKGVRSIK